MRQSPSRKWRMCKFRTAKSLYGRKGAKTFNRAKKRYWIVRDNKQPGVFTGRKGQGRASLAFTG
jgi:hypothetical protein